ncbi:hypothetical protein [Rubinisphaera brasiliensis]|uniref:Uncharacterized protein n=1 Tax=Rubinisphaera brasiliensis (strain ATCC 49424 / DSM 5305 / JCM 21570 / IAM 15109 / NBRC 103401 / IFAM 1448) TaxID=756272 RepID=F0SM76_RUBBR|nr:hypothetical protein [Rubinisphaera brasiliensis]ADY61031.1 hypothetical protein Plabr_3434 [Rubinisphaera brasiliensis DSM 5305]
MQGVFPIVAGLTIVFGSLFAQPASVQAQPLLWNLPESGTWVRYTGEYRQVTVRPESSEGDLSLQWQRVLEIRCLDRETADWKGEQTACVWLEIEQTTGQQVDGQLEAGPGGTRMYKILVPESVVIGKEYFNLDVPRAYLPIVKGWRQIGDGAEVEELQGHVFQPFPLVTQLLINESASISGQESAQVVAGSFQSDKIENTDSFEDSDSRTTVTSNLWISDDVPFGMVKWTSRIVRERKTLIDSRDAFKKHSEINVQMQAAQTGNDAVSKMNTP